MNAMYRNTSWMYSHATKKEMRTETESEMKMPMPALWIASDNLGTSQRWTMGCNRGMMKWGIHYTVNIHHFIAFSSGNREAYATQKPKGMRTKNDAVVLLGDGVRASRGVHLWADSEVLGGRTHQQRTSRKKRRDLISSFISHAISSDACNCCMAWSSLGVGVLRVC